MASGQGTTRSPQATRVAQHDDAFPEDLDRRTGEIVRIQHSGLVQPIATVTEIKAAAERFYEIVNAFTTDDDFQIIERGKRFPKKTYYTKVAAFFGVSTEPIDRDQPVFHFDEHGNPTWAEAHVRATAQNGRVEVGYGACSLTEARFVRPASRQRLHHDLGSTAETRARNRAISQMFPYATEMQVSWEEAEGGSDVVDDDGGHTRRRDPPSPGKKDPELREDQRAVQSALTQLAELRNNNGQTPKTNWATILWQDLLPTQPRTQRHAWDLTPAQCEEILDAANEMIGKEADTIDGDVVVSEEV